MNAGKNGIALIAVAILETFILFMHFIHSDNLIHSQGIWIILISYLESSWMHVFCLFLFSLFFSLFQSSAKTFHSMSNSSCGLHCEILTFEPDFKVASVKTPSVHLQQQNWQHWGWKSTDMQAGRIIGGEIWCIYHSAWCALCIFCINDFQPHQGMVCDCWHVHPP